MKYRLLCSTTPYSLETLVERELKNGWQLQGGASVSSANISATALFAQAVTKED